MIYLFNIFKFGRERAHTFTAGKPKTASPTISRVPSERPTAWPSMPPSLSSSPTITKYEVEVTITLDKGSSETGWYIASDDDVVIIDRPTGWYTGNDSLTVVETIRLEAGNYVFSVLDTNGDGFCCSQGIGLYSLYSNGELLLFQQGKFEYKYTEQFSINSNEKENTSLLDTDSDTNNKTPLANKDPNTNGKRPGKRPVQGIYPNTNDKRPEQDKDPDTNDETATFTFDKDDKNPFGFARTNKLLSSKSAPMLRGADSSSYNLKRQREHVGKEP